MSNNGTSHAFEKLPLPRKATQKSAVGKYRVYKDADNFSQVDANSALEALQASGLQEAYRIERDTILVNNAMILDALTDNIPVEAAKAEEEKPVAETVQPAAAEPAAAEAVAAVPEVTSAAAAAAADMPLSPDDVNKLLDGK